MIIRHHGTDTSKVDPRTQEARYTDPWVGQWYSTTQVWSWDGGDAIVVMTGEIGRAECWVVLREGNTIRVTQQDGLNAALRWWGILPYGEKVEIV